MRQCLESGAASALLIRKWSLPTAQAAALAKAHNAAFLFEGQSVGGGTPIITPMHQCLAANTSARSAASSTALTNFMLTKMKRENILTLRSNAQQFWPCRVSSDLATMWDAAAMPAANCDASLACGLSLLYPDNIPARGIRITVADIKAAEKLTAIKLIAWYT